MFDAQLRRVKGIEAICSWVEWNTTEHPCWQQHKEKLRRVVGGWTTEEFFGYGQRVSAYLC